MLKENVLDKENWKVEAQHVINDIKQHVSSISISTEKPSSNQQIYLNIKTLENKDFCVELSSLGFKIVGECFDNDNIETTQYYETPYSLLLSISDEYKHSFGNELIDKLSDISSQCRN
ncbi:unnamed protein product [Brassicogethes aeneus]|uniref:GSKIP domain-containing protein n=1 Tax=Brassicogethes aeneus TaxID=1431903 RepID=A0A9P0F9Q6_BRAAE|nr:unnamed protein product [Brassicogethes aeneus]